MNSFSGWHMDCSYFHVYWEMSMTTVANPGVLLPSVDGVRGKEPAQRTAEKPQHRFADAPALANLVERVRPDKNGDKAIAGSPPAGEQGTLDTRKRKSQSVSDGSQVAGVINLSDVAADVPVRTGKAVTKQRVDTAPQGQTGNDAVVKNRGLEEAFATRTSPRDPSVVAVQRSDQASSKSSSMDQGPAVEVPQGADHISWRPRVRSQPDAVSTREGAPASQNPQAQVTGSVGKKAHPGYHEDAASKQTQSPAQAVGQPVAEVARPADGAQTHAGSDAGAAENPIRNVSEQILDSVRTSVPQGDRQILVRLQPPELGTVVVRFQEQGGHLEGTLEVGKSDTRREIEQALPEVVRGLQEAGIQIRRLDVTTGDSAERDFGRGQPQQEAWPGQHGPGQNRDYHPASQTPWSRPAADYPADSRETPSAGRQIDVPQGRIDMFL